jgi:bifunctional UDP-N-acetylglucosamine pyrophosphorylase/glucosamine-1-phosphate N-acetyltransferase
MEETLAKLNAARTRLLEAGVIMMDPNAVYPDEQAVVGKGTVLLPGTILRGKTVVGENCTIGPNVMLTDTTVEDNVTINTAQVEQSVIRTGCEIGPYTHIRPHCDVGEGSKIGAFVQLKNCNLGKGTKMAHLTYVGDADVGERVNFGCGTVTCNYDGNVKSRTTIGNDCFVGCNTNLVAPVTLADGVYTAAGSTVTDDVEQDALVIARSRQQVKPGWAAEHRKKKIKK